MAETDAFELGRPDARPAADRHAREADPPGEGRGRPLRPLFPGARSRRAGGL